MLPRVPVFTFYTAMDLFVFFQSIWNSVSTCGGSSRACRVFYFEGNVGVGKTECMHSVAEMLRERHLSVACLEENTEAWVSEGLLGCKYSGEEAKFNVHGLLCDYLRRHKRLMDLREENDVVLVERHPSTSLKVFGVDVLSKKLFEEVGDAVPGFLNPVPAHTVYVKNSARACADRVRRRARTEEKSIEDFTFETWGDLHDDMMREREAMGGKVYVFDAFGADAHTLTPSIVTALGY